MYIYSGLYKALLSIEGSEFPGSVRIHQVWNYKVIVCNAVRKTNSIKCNHGCI